MTRDAVRRVRSDGQNIRAFEEPRVLDPGYDRGHIGDAACVARSLAAKGIAPVGAWTPLEGFFGRDRLSTDPVLRNDMDVSQRI